MIQVWIFLSVIPTMWCSKSLNGSAINLKPPLNKSIDKQEGKEDSLKPVLLDRAGQNGGHQGYLVIPPPKHIIDQFTKKEVYLETTLHESKDKHREDDVYIEKPLDGNKEEHGEDVYLETPLDGNKDKHGEDEVYLEKPFDENKDKHGEDEVYLEKPLDENKDKHEEDEIYLEKPLDENKDKHEEDEIYLEKPLDENKDKHEVDEVYLEKPLDEHKDRHGEEEVYLEKPLDENKDKHGEDEVYLEKPLDENKDRHGEDEVYLEKPLDENKDKHGEDEVYLEKPLDENKRDHGEKEVFMETSFEDSKPQKDEREVNPKTPLKDSKSNHTEFKENELVRSCKWIEPPENSKRFISCAQGLCEVTPFTVYSMNGTIRITRCNHGYVLVQGHERDICHNGKWSSIGHICEQTKADHGNSEEVEEELEGTHFLYGILTTKKLTNATNYNFIVDLMNQAQHNNLDALSSAALPTAKKEGCTRDAQCPDNRRCVDQSCLDMCPGVCGDNSICNMVEHFPVCSCSPGYTGNPYNSCTKEKEEGKEDMPESNVYLKPAECRWITRSAYPELPGSTWGVPLGNDTCFTTENQLDPGQFSTFKRGEFPYLGVIGDKEFKLRRYGALISEQWFLSTASCADPKICNARVKLGIHDNNLRRSPWMPEYIIVRVEVHADYDGDVINDIGLYKLHTEVRFTQFIRPACLVTEFHTPGTKGIFIGRLNGTLMKTTTKLLPDSQCKNITSNIYKDSILCVNPFRSANSLRMYNGFPLVGPIQKPYCMYGLLGMLTFGESGKAKGYMRMAYYVPWIEYKILPTCRPQLPTLPPVGS